MYPNVTFCYRQFSVTLPNVTGEFAKKKILGYILYPDMYPEMYPELLKTGFFGIFRLHVPQNVPQKMYPAYLRNTLRVGNLNPTK
jgi:hypothetical protein